MTGRSPAPATSTARANRSAPPSRSFSDTSTLPNSATSASSTKSNRSASCRCARSETTAMPTLHIVSGPLKGQQIELTGERFVVGRAPDCALVLDTPQASRNHACFYVADGRWRLQDLGSVNGTVLNGRKIQDSDLHPGDKVKVGDCEMIFQDAEAAVMTAVP
ncbi:MAG: FHA domain-containing protein, partial [Verrucomicrobia bacterium]|nr:FHA domain-containing protein [Verrucomicrobiota bacterium]